MTETQMPPEFLYVCCAVEGVVDEKFGKIGIGGRGDEVYGQPYKPLRQSPHVASWFLASIRRVDTWPWVDRSPLDKCTLPILP